MGAILLGRDAEELDMRVYVVMFLVYNWLHENHLELTEEKTNFEEGDTENQSKHIRKRGFSKNLIKHLGVWIESKLNFFSHIQNTTN